ncbi:MAG: hypothetical protein J6M62_10925 [Selenomonadaceae bacterium]|nr:hypothetical protein [Selenomonadaceae bacterium]
MESEVKKNKYSNGLISIKSKKNRKLRLKRIEGVKSIPEQGYSEMLPEEVRDEEFEMRAERARAEIDEALSDTGWTLEKINSEIVAARLERRAEKSKGGF